MRESERQIAWTRRELLRRGVITGGAVWAGALTLPSCGGVEASPRRKGTAIGPGWSVRHDAQADGLGEDSLKHYVLSMFDLDEKREVQTTPLDFYGHGVVFDPTDPARALVFEKRGFGACEVDLVRREVQRPIETTREFYGHGAFSPDGALLYATETDVDDDYRGVIVIRDGKTLEEIGEFPSFGAAPHDCTLRDDGRTLVVTNDGARKRGGSAPCVTYVDIQSQTLIEKLTFENEDITAGHLTLSPAGDLAVTSSIRPWLTEESTGAASFRPVGGEFRTMTEPADVTSRMLGESLSVAIHAPSGIAGVTNPKGNLVTFWDLAKGRLLGKLDFAYPRGISVTLDNEYFIVSYGTKTSLIYVSPETLEALPESRIPETFMAGSHLFLHDLSGARTA